jgi:hypothetical protein
MPRAPMRVPSARPGLPRWLLPLAIVALVALVAGAVVAWRLLGRGADPGAVRRRAEGHSLLLRDDRTSLARAVVAFDDAYRLEPRLVEARADRDLARALILGLVQGEALRAEARLATRQQERAALVQEGGAVPATLADEIASLGAQLEAVRARARELEQRVSADLAALGKDRRREVRRAAAMLDAFASDPARADTLATREPPARDDDPFLALARAAAEARARTPERREEAVARLLELVKGHPELLRARLVLAEALAHEGHPQEAAAALDPVLAASPEHEDAGALKAELLAPPPARPVQAAVPARSPPEGTPGLLPRKSVTQAQADAGQE